MKEALAKLYAVQEIDTSLLETRRRINALDMGKSALDAKNAAVEAHETADKQLKAYTADLHDSELQLKSVEEKKKKYESKLYDGSIHNPKELDNTKKEIEMLGRQRDTLDGKILELWELIETAKVEEAKTRAEREEKETIYNELVQKGQSQKAALEQQGALLTQKRKAAAAAADAALMARYDKLRLSHAGVAVAKVNDEQCGACQNKIPSFTLARLKEGANQVITCENCNRILYFTD